MVRKPHGCPWVTLDPEVKTCALHRSIAPPPVPLGDPDLLLAAYAVSAEDPRRGSSLPIVPSLPLSPLLAGVGVVP